MMIEKTLKSLTYYTSNADPLLRVLDSELAKLEEQFYTGLVSISRNINEISSLIILLDDLFIDINLDEFKGLL